MISTVAAGSADPLRVATLLLMGLVVVAGLTLTIVRALRSTRSREEQMARLTAQLDGRNEELIRVAYCRGYSLIDHQVWKYYEFVFTPHHPGRSA